MRSARRTERQNGAGGAQMDSLARVLLEELPEDRIGRNVSGRWAEEPDGRHSPRPGVPSPFYRVEDDFASLFARTPNGADDRRSVFRLVGQLRLSPPGRTAIRFHPRGNRVLD